MTNTIATIDFYTTDAATIADAYAAADAPGKARMRAAAEKAMTDAIGRAATDPAGAMADAMAAKAARDAMVTEKAASVIDYAAMVADHRATLVRAIAMIDNGDFTMPEGVDASAAEGWIDRVGVANEKAAAAMTVVRGRKAGRGAVIDYIDSVLGDAPMTISDIRKAHVPTADYPTNPPSAGAIGAAFDRIDDGRADADFVVVSIDGKRGAARA
jgi:hypothetical protein